VGAAGSQNSPGERYEYSDVGSATLGALVEEISGMPVEKFIQDRILEPLAMPSYDVVALVFTQSRGSGVIRQFPMAVWNGVSAGEESAPGEG